MIDDDWRRWIAENLMLGTTAGSIIKTMAAKGIPEALAVLEVTEAVSSPYLRAAERIKSRLDKRDWGYALERKLRRLQPSFGRIARHKRLPRELFLVGDYAANRPVVITGMIDHWLARLKWDLHFLRTNFGDREIEVQAGRNAVADYEIKQQSLRQRMPFGDFIAALETPGNDLYMTANNGVHNRQALAELWDDIGPIPEYLSSDAGSFLWIGPAGTITPLHHDLTNNFMAQVRGRKRVLLIPPCETPNVYNHFHVYSEVDAGNVDLARFPLMRGVEILELVIGPGDLLFVPVGWWHYVKALDASITVSFTNFLWDNDFHSFYRTYQEV